ncbi:MAG: site-specific tyrosine recombinase XerC [Chloroflexota bacterium]
MRGRRRHELNALPPAGNDPEGLAAHLFEYLEALRVKNYAEGTVESRLVDLRLFTRWCAERSITRSREVTRPILERYQRWLFHYRRPDGKPLGFRTQQYRITALRSFFRYLSRANHIPANPAADLELPRIGWRLPGEALTASEAEAVLAQPDVTKPLGLRDRAIMETFYSTGIRRAELAALSVFDVDAERGTLFVRQGKGKKDRVVPIGERALTWLHKYREDVRPELVVAPDPGMLFLGALGEPLGIGWLTIMVRRYVLRAVTGKRGACHLFRHTVATLMLEGGADVRYVQEMLGHAKLDTTQLYTHVTITALKAIHAATHPAALLHPRRTRTGDAPRVSVRELASSLAADPSAATREEAAELLETLGAELAEEDPTEE